MTPAEKRAREVAKYFERYKEFTAEVTTEIDPGLFRDDGTCIREPFTLATISVNEEYSLGGARLWCIWRSKKSGQTAFLGGRYSFTPTGPDKLIRRSLPHLRSIASTFVDVYTPMSGKD
jgi:hypothetical protein